MPNSIDRTKIALRDLGKAVAIAFLALAAFIAGAAARDSGRRRWRHPSGHPEHVRGNLVRGIDCRANAEQLLAAVATIYNNIVASKPAERAAAMAREIARNRPDLVALQEAAMLRTGNGGPATTVRSDLLQLLLDELAGLGHRYRAVAIIPGLDAQAPSLLGFDVRITIQDAILVRSRSVGDAIKVSNLQIEQFGIKLSLPTFSVRSRTRAGGRRST